MNPDYLEKTELRWWSKAQILKAVQSTKRTLVSGKHMKNEVLRSTFATRMQIILKEFPHPGEALRAAPMLAQGSSKACAHLIDCTLYGSAAKEGVASALDRQERKSNEREKEDSGRWIKHRPLT